MLEKALHLAGEFSRIFESIYFWGPSKIAQIFDKKKHLCKTNPDKSLSWGICTICLNG